MGETSSSSTSFASLLRKCVWLPFGFPVADASFASLPLEWQDFRRSGPPKKVVIIKGKGDFASTMPLPELFKNAFVTGSAVATLVVSAVPGGKLYFDFLRKVVVFIDAQGIRKVAGLYWVDEDGWIFSPPLWGDADEASVRKAFDEASDGRLAITAVRRCHHRESRTVGFLDKMKVHGAWVFGWYGGAADDVQDAADGGDLTVNWQLLGAARAYGRGIHLSAQGKPMASADISALSMNDPKTTHLLYCALAPGFLEIIPAGSPQSGPISSIFGSGIDDAKQPTWHVFWESLVGTQVLPLYIISFRPTGTPEVTRGQQGPQPHMGRLQVRRK